MADNTEKNCDEAVNIVQNDDSFMRFLQEMYQKELNEQAVSDRRTEETLQKLGISIENMPQKCQKLLEEAAQCEKCFGLNGLEKDGINLKNVRKQSDEMDEEYEILKLQHKNVELQSKINKNAKDIAQLKQDIEQARKSLRCQKPNPETIKDEMRTMKIKLATYEENYEKAKAKFTKLGIPEEVYPKSIEILISQLAALKSQELELKQLVDDVMYTRQVRNKLNKLRL